MRPLILYSSFQTGEFLPEYIRYVLLQLASLGDVILLTNRRRLAATEEAFLKEQGIELFLTENSGFDFGMWKRYLEKNPCKTQRLLLLNDSIVYYRKCFKEFLEKAEQVSASAVGLLENKTNNSHLQSFFMYLKNDAIKLFEKHLQETPLTENFEKTIQTFEIAVSQKWKSAGLQTHALFTTDEDPIFSYGELILQKAGFIKKRLLERRFSFEMQKHFWLNGKSDVLYKDYKKLICMYGEKDAQFKKEFFPGYTKLFLSRNTERLNGIIYRILAHFYFRFIKKQKRT